MALTDIPTRLTRTVETTALGFVRSRSDRQLALLTRRPVRDVGRLVLVPALLARFDGRRAKDTDATYELRLQHPSGEGYDPVTIRVRDGRCTVLPRPARAPDVVLGARLDHLLQLVTGQASVTAMLGDRRLTFHGDPFLFMAFPGMFGGLG